MLDVVLRRLGFAICRGGGLLVVAAFMLGCEAVNSSGLEESPPVYGSETARLGFEISIPSDLEDMGWGARDPAFFSGRISDQLRGMVLDRAYTIAIDSPGGGLQLQNNAHEFGNFTRTTRLVVYVYHRPGSATAQQVAESVGGVAYQILDSEINGFGAKQLLYLGSQEAERPRTDEEVLIPKYVLENGGFVYFVLFWPSQNVEADAAVRRILDTFRLVNPA